MYLVLDTFELIRYILSSFDRIMCAYLPIPQVKEAPQLLCDNLGATHLSFNPVNHSRMKHIQIDLHFVRDLVHKGSLQVKHVHTQDQLADLLTKPLSKQRTELLRNKIGLADGSPILRGRIREAGKNPLQTKTEHG